MLDPLPFLLACGNPDVVRFARRDLAGVHVLPAAPSREVASLLRGQNPDGSWGRPGGYPAFHRPLVETFKRMHLLVGLHELDRAQPGIAAAAEFLFATRSPAGDFRGMLGDQYAPYYTGEFVQGDTRTIPAAARRANSVSMRRTL
jgi:hypothetical protein